MSIIKAYKGFNRDMTCRGYQFEEGKTYELPEGAKAKLCKSGFHACEDPLDCYRYYAPGTSIYREVELDATEEREPDETKRVGTAIRIGAALDVAKICRLHFEYVKKRCNPVDGRVGGDHESVSVGYKASASAGNRGSASAGDLGSASAGNGGSASAGNRGSASAGNGGSASAGNRGSASAGNRGSASAGNGGSASAGDLGSASAGNGGSAVSRGQSSSGANGVSVARGNGVRVRGGLGAVLVLCEEKYDDYEIHAWKAAVVDGEVIKPDTWYRLNDDGKFVECQEGANDGDDD